MLIHIISTDLYNFSVLRRLAVVSSAASWQCQLPIGIHLSPMPFCEILAMAERLSVHKIVYTRGQSNESLNIPTKCRSNLSIMSHRRWCWFVCRLQAISSRFAHKCVWFDDFIGINRQNEFCLPVYCNFRTTVPCIGNSSVRKYSTQRSIPILALPFYRNNTRMIIMKALPFAVVCVPPDRYYVQTIVECTTHK